MARDERRGEKSLFDGMEGMPRPSTDQLTCSRCKKKECNYRQMVPRSGDETITTYVTCRNCQKVRKFSLPRLIPSKI